MRWLLMGALVTVAVPAAASHRHGHRRARATSRHGHAQDKRVAPTHTGPTKIAILDLGALGISSDMMRNLQMLLRNSVATIENRKVIPPVDIEMALQDPKNKAVAQCGGGPKCAVEVGRLVGADVVVFGTIGAIGQAYSLNLRALDVHTGKEIARQQTSISGTRDLLIPEMRLATFRLLAPDHIVGSLLVDVDVKGVDVEIDGKSVGTTPLPQPVGNLTPGEHVVVLKRPGFSQFQQKITIKPFETARLKLTLKKETAGAAGTAPAAGGSAPSKAP